jgi:hypothetical protein
MHQRLNKPGSDKTSSRGNSFANNCTKNLYTGSLNPLFIQRTPANENKENGFDEDEMDEEETQDAEHISVQKKCDECEKEEKAQRSTLSPFIQTKANDDGGYTDDAISSKIQSTRGGGQALPETTKTFMQRRFGADFSNIKIHTGNYAADLSTQLNAQAFTVGNDIYFNSGKFSPSTSQGKKLIAHELTHTIQQNNNKVSAQPKVQRSFWSWIKKVAGTVWGGVKKVGQWIGTGAKWIWKGVKWLGGQLIDKVAGVFQRIAYWMSQLPARVARLLSTLWKGLKTFKPWTLKWWKSLADIDTWKGFLKWILTVALQSLEIGGLGEAYETIMDLIKFNTRVLSASELKAAKSIFGNSINFDFVRVDIGAVIGPAFSHRAYTSFHTINSWGTESTDVMVHELTHVWQYENAGAIYMPQAVHAQVWGGGYEYGDVTELQTRRTAGKGLLSFNREQQAQIVEDFFRLRQNMPINDHASTATRADLPLFGDFVQTVSSLSRAQLMTPI